VISARCIKFTPAKPLDAVKNGRIARLNRQGGAALISAIFVITALAALGAVMMQMMVMGSEESLNEWHSAQALYAAESGVDWAIWDISQNGGDGSGTDQTVTNQAWVTTAVNQTVAGDKVLYEITSTGKAGGVATQPMAQRQVIVKFMP